MQHPRNPPAAPHQGGHQNKGDEGIAWGRGFIIHGCDASLTGGMYAVQLAACELPGQSRVS